MASQSSLGDGHSLPVEGPQVPSVGEPRWCVEPRSFPPSTAQEQRFVDHRACVFEKSSQASKLRDAKGAVFSQPPFDDAPPIDAAPAFHSAIHFHPSRLAQRMAQPEGEPPDLWYFDLMTGSPDRQATRSSDFLFPPSTSGRDGDAERSGYAFALQSLTLFSVAVGQLGRAASDCRSHCRIVVVAFSRE